MEMSALMKAELAATCSTLGRINSAAAYVVDPQCFHSVRDLIRFIRRDDAWHEVRLYLGDAKILQTDLVHIATITDNVDLFDITLRLMVNLTNPVILLYKEEVPAEKTGRNIYMRLLSHTQEYKTAFCKVEFWKAIMKKLTDLFEIDWTERSEDSSLQIERILVLLRNVLQVPADSELEQRPDNDVTVHDRVLWALRESQLFELLLYVASNRDEEKYFLHLLEIFSLMLREQSPAALAQCEVGRSAAEKERDLMELTLIREREKMKAKCYKNTRNYHQTFVLKNVKSISDNDVVYHKSIHKLNQLKLTQDKKRVKTPKHRFPENSERVERRSTFSVRLFLKEFCVELLSCSFNHLMGTVKDKLVSGKGLANDESYYFWALKFFLEFTCTANLDVKLVSECINVQTFHFVQTQIDNCYDHIASDKRKMNTWIRRLHLTLKAYRSLLQTLMWMDSSKDSTIRDMSKILKNNVFYVPEYREIILTCLFKYDNGRFPLSFLRDLIETNHISLKLLENYCKSSKIVVQKNKRLVKKRPSKKPKAQKELPTFETPEMIWEKIKDVIYEAIDKNSDILEIVPFDAASSVPIDEQKEEAMKNIQKKLRKFEVKEAIGLLRSSRQVWPENDSFGSADLSTEDEVMVLQEICMAELGVVCEDNAPVVEMEESDEEDSEGDKMEVVEQTYDIADYAKKLVHKKIIEGGCLLLSNYKRNSVNTNHCVVKLLYRIGWQCKVPAMLYQASLFITLNKILQENTSAYKEIQTFAKQLFKKFREDALNNPKIFMELLFWKEPKIAIEISEGYGSNEAKSAMKGTWSEEEEDELRRLWVEFDQNMLGGDKIDWIKDNLINDARSRIGIIKKLKELMLIAPGVKVSKKSLGRAEWSEDEISLLRQLFEQHKEAMDVAEMIRDRMMARSKKSIKEKLVELGLVSSLADLRKKKPRKGRKSQNLDPSPERLVDSTSSESEHEDVEVVSRFSAHEAVAALRTVESMKPALKWLKETFTECIEDEDDVCSDGYPLLALDSTHSDALENDDFQNVLRKLHISEPNSGQIYWKIRGNKIILHEALELIDAAINGKLEDIPENSTFGRRAKDAKGKISDDSDSEDDFDKLRRVLPGSLSPVDGGNENDQSQNSTKNARNLISTVEADVNIDVSQGADGNECQSSSRSRTGQTRASRHNRSLRSDDSDSESNKSPPWRTTNAVDSDKSDKGEASGEETSPVKKSSAKIKLAQPKSRKARFMGSDDSDSEAGSFDGDHQHFDAVRPNKFGASGKGRSYVKAATNNRSMKSSGSSHMARRSRIIESDDSDASNSIKESGVNGHALDSDRSDKGGASGEELTTQRSLSSRRSGRVASDSEGDEVPQRDYWHQKRRRCIGSDSEIEGHASEDEMGQVPREVRKKSRLLDSDSEVEGHGSADEFSKLSR